mmetsp:Transcript_46204/g.128860  ORF Transcript_46204/g.128860 Transcript_46204/m.128860 type:complete len:458 (-) Transcript_46204:191-1564(-)|eukprot:CAMPEP_0119543848 /NCGR_PEP_ID=MMETSP1344-20130328/54376_1 /TAXON_ID=236787 /ORGANISM="Florenciella parvula, Strain CCMP2471" /LENGTH=457 /DNA_ID=CAMNT_0007588245 /DNA_START=23 /DNA_END=1396 /DNA_ORIENTATION=+
MTSVASSRRVAAFLTTALLVGGASSFIPGSATGLLKLRYKAALPSARNRPYHVSRSVIHAKLPKLGDRTDGEIASAPRFAMPTLPGLSKAAVAMALAASLMMSPAPALSADGAAIGKCLLKSCQLELAKCVTNPKCAANLLCIQTCNGRADEAACQIGCGDLFENDVVGEFNACAVSQKSCVPQRQDDGSYPFPPLESIDQKFSTKNFEGRWYISAGLNKVFDTFPCQVHFFTSPQEGVLYGKLNWRIVEPDGEFFTKNAVQRFVQDPKNPGILYNHDNEYLHYKDDWYILDSDKDFFLVYYRGSNDAWDGYGGAFLYTREPTVPPALVPRLEAAAKRANLNFDDFVRTDNTCPTLDPKDIPQLRERYAKKELILTEDALAQQVTAVRGNAVSAISSEEKEAVKAISKLEKLAENDVRQLEKVLEKEAIVIEKEVIVIEKEVEKDVGSLFKKQPERN